MTGADVSPGLIAGRYELGRPLGRGSFGHTFLAQDRVSGKAVAVKVLDPREAGDFKAAELFEREATVLRSLRHQGIPEVFDVVRDAWKGTTATFLVMEYLEGESLAAMIEGERQLDSADVLNVFLEMLGILEYLHSRVPPILHRDIKPSNILIRSGGRPALVDFGSVRRIFRAADEMGSTVAGTYGYMPYEQYMGQATPASDLYALGATFLHLLTGRPPRDFMNDEGRIAVPRDLPGEARLAPIIARLLRPSPTERFATARDVRNALLVPVADAPPPVQPTRVARRPDQTTVVPWTRPLKRPERELLKRVAPSALELMSGGDRRNQQHGAFDWMTVVFFSILTAGILPITFLSIARARRGRLRTFIQEGVQASAVIQDLQIERIAFDQPMVRVSYEFEADGEVHRDGDLVLPSIADRWRAGDLIDILYRPEYEYDSVIISAG